MLLSFNNQFRVPISYLCLKLVGCLAFLEELKRINQSANYGRPCSLLQLRWLRLIVDEGHELGKQNNEEAEAKKLSKHKKRREKKKRRGKKKSNWIEKNDGDGVYYFNTKTKESTKQRPTDLGL
mgnify:CR=1 FL=1